MDPDQIMENLSKELGVAVKALGKAKTLEDKVAYSQVVRNLSESLGVFLGLAGDMMEFNDEDPFLDED
ncbi:MAG: hypothetical protein KJ950_11025 [Proteobacteria bacterium]|nr:hypothetical protein [Pseudomonadota bacterium]MBU1687709.1 hypothetical protein [Pseudomonadota bacterium]